MDVTLKSNWTSKLVFKYLLFLLACCLLAYWPLTFGLFSLKNDAIIYFLPIRYLISEVIQDNYWPFWTPYLNLGYPLHGDLQSGVWNPFVQLFSVFGTYSLRTLQIETLLYVYLSGVSMLFLLKHFNLHRHVVLLVACSYMLFGFNSDSAQFLYWISGAAFLPFVFLFFYRTLFETSIKQSILFGFFLFLYFTTSYPGQFILLVYLLLVFSIWFVIKNKIYKSRKTVFEYAKLISIAAIAFLLLSGPAIISYMTYLPLMHRGEGVSFELAMSNPLHPVFLFSYISPLAVWRVPFWTPTDPLTRNCYIGLAAFILFLTSFFSKSHTGFIKFCKWSALIFLVFSFGEIGILRPITYYALPLMDSFRHPSIAKLFFNFFACLLAAFCLQMTAQEKINYKLRRNIFLFVILLSLFLLVWGATYIQNSQLFNLLSKRNMSWEEAKSSFDHLSFFDLLLINIFIQIPFFFLLYNCYVKKVILKKLLIGSAVNCTVLAMLFQPFTVVRKESRTSVQNVLNTYIKNGFPVPDIGSTVNANSVNNLDSVLKYGPLSLYSKKIGHTFNFLTPGRLKSQEQFWENKELKEILFQYPLLFRADTAFLNTKNISNQNLKGRKIVVTHDTSLINYINSNTHRSPFAAQFQSFSPNNWTINIESDEPGFYCLLQNNFPLWQMEIDGIKVQVETCNITYMGFRLEKGKHLVSLTYKATRIKVAFMISILLTIAIICWYLQLYFRKIID